MTKSTRLYIAMLATTLLTAAPVAYAGDEPAPAPGAASIRGDIVEGFVGVTHQSRIVAVDGNLVTGEIKPCEPVALTPGLHSLVVAYEDTDLPIRLEAKADTSYVVKWSGDDPRTVYVEDTNTGTTVGKISTDFDRNADAYVDPVNDMPSLATIKTVQITKHDFLFGDLPVGQVFVSSIDGHLVPGYESGYIDRKYITTPHMMTSGEHALVISARFVFPTANYEGFVWLNTPILFTAKSSKTYLLKYTDYETATSSFNTTYKFWIEEADTGKIVYPEKLYPTNFHLGGRYHLAGVPVHEETTFPAQHGQLQKRPQTPKPWCQHEG